MDISRVVDEVKLVEGGIAVVCGVLVDISGLMLVSGHIRVIHSVFVDVICGVTVIALFVRFVMCLIGVVDLVLIDISCHIYFAIAGDTASTGLLSVVIVGSDAILLGLLTAISD